MEYLPRVFPQFYEIASLPVRELLGLIWSKYLFNSTSTYITKPVSLFKP